MPQHILPQLRGLPTVAREQGEERRLQQCANRGHCATGWPSTSRPPKSRPPAGTWWPHGARQACVSVLTNTWRHRSQACVSVLNQHVRGVTMHLGVVLRPACTAQLPRQYFTNVVTGRIGGSADEERGGARRARVRKKGDV